MARVTLRQFPWGQTIRWECPGCGCGHWVQTRTDGKEPSWSFNGDPERPTLTPSVLVNPGRECPRQHQCHLFMTDGVLHFLADCSHPLAGQAVPMEPIADAQG
jgi:hypothetical protein